MSFLLVPNLVTLDDIEQRNSPNRRLISPNSVAFGRITWKVRNRYFRVFILLPYSS